MRIGVLGLASSHVDQVLRLSASGALGPDVRVSALGVPAIEPVEASRAEALLAAATVPELLVGDPATLAAALADQADAVLLTTRDAGTHRALAEPLLRAGVPLLVDKPFTADPADAAALVRLADRLGVPLTSSSALRWHPATRAARDRWAADPAGVAVVATGPAVPQDPHGGLATYAVHAVEAALTVLRTVPSADAPVAVTAGTGVRTATVRAGRDLATITVVAPRGGEQTPFHLAVTGAVGRTDDAITLGADYLLPALRAFAAGVAAGRRDRVGPTGDALVATVRVTAALSA